MLCCARIRHLLKEARPQHLASTFDPARMLIYRQVLYYVRTPKHLEALWFANVGNQILWWTYVKACWRAVGSMIAKKGITFKTTMKVQHTSHGCWTCICQQPDSPRLTGAQFSIITEQHRAASPMYHPSGASAAGQCMFTGVLSKRNLCVLNPQQLTKQLLFAPVCRVAA